MALNQAPTPSGEGIKGDISKVHNFLFLSHAQITSTAPLSPLATYLWLFFTFLLH